MSIFANEKIQASLTVINGKNNDSDSDFPIIPIEVCASDNLEDSDLFLEMHKTTNQDHLTFPSQVLTPKTYKIDEGAAFEKVRDKICADPAMAALMKKTEEKYSNNTVTDEVRNPLTETAEKLVEEKKEVDKLLSELLSELPPETQTPMAEAFRTANKNRDRNRNRGRGHRE